MKALIFFFFLFAGLPLFAQVPIDLHQRTPDNVADSTHLVLVSHPTTGLPKKATIGTVFKNNAVFGRINYLNANPDTTHVTMGEFKLFINTATDSIFFMIRDTSGLIRYEVAVRPEE